MVVVAVLPLVGQLEAYWVQCFDEQTSVCCIVAYYSFFGPEPLQVLA